MPLWFQVYYDWLAKNVKITAEAKRKYIEEKHAEEREEDVEYITCHFHPRIENVRRMHPIEAKR
tara:strand:- start:577 stop:768 length:192 start_codon:yes stop_codon:yes gene_type:complete